MKSKISKFFGLLLTICLIVTIVSCSQDLSDLFQVSFNVDGGTAVTPQQVENGGKAEKPTDPTKVGYNFSGWYKESTFVTEFIFSVEIITKDTIVYAKWDAVPDIIRFTVTFDADGGAPTPDALIVEQDSTITKPTDPTKDGYTFDAWYKDSAHTSVWDFAVDRVMANITLYAKWNAIVTTESFIISFDADGGTLPDSQTVDKDNLITKPTDPVKNGYDFDAWYKDSAHTSVWDFAVDRVTEDITLYAKWVARSLEVIFEHNFDSDGNTSLYFESNENVGSNYGTYTYKNYEYTKGYKVNASSTITFETDEDNLVLILVIGRRFTEPTTEVLVNGKGYPINSNAEVLEIDLPQNGSVTISRGGNKEFGIFFMGLYRTSQSVRKHTIKFNTTGGSDMPDLIVEDKHKGSFNQMPVKTDLDFDGWYLDEDLTQPFDINQEIVSSLTLYAKWSVLEEFSVIVDGTVYLVKDGRILPELTPVFQAGKVFVRWLSNDQTFDVKTPIRSNFTITSEYRDAHIYSLSYDLDNGYLDGDLTVNYYEYDEIMLPTPTKEGFIFAGWYTDNLHQTKFATKNLTADTVIYASWIDENMVASNFTYGSYLESVYALWDDENPENAQVKYKSSDSSNWIDVDSQLVRKSAQSDQARVDIVGLKEGYYDLWIISSIGTTVVQNHIYTAAHDRSGYAHFNYTTGIGGYNDDGTLKSNAVVVYVTEENKDTIQIPGLPQTGLGWILNNAQYTKQGSTTYGQYQNAQTIAAFNQPIVFRIIGKVTTPEGATGYNSLVNGGSVGDNGHMLRIKDANHITIEGIGEDAEIYGWGIHFMASVAGRGEGFHVRNLTFRHYPEDAIGMEGVQTGSTLTAPVTRGWIHHVTFFEGYSAQPAESDKAEGDGSLDIKRGEYFTISYNQFRGAHKTNLVGASDSNLQYHITFHHNWWQNNASRIPLARQANIHMYNNVFEITDDNTNEVSYAQNTRANAYIFSEANYFYATKNPGDVRSGAIKSYNDVFYSTYDSHGATVVSSRTQAVSSGNKFENFDTDYNVFYYDAATQKTSVMHLTDAVTARAEVAIYSGHYKVWDTPNIDQHKITDVTPTTIDESISVSGPIKISKGQPLLVFRLTTDAEFQMTTGTASVLPVLSTIYGQYLIEGSGTVVLTPGVYVIESRQSHGASKGTSQAKDSSVGSYSITLDSGAASQGRIDDANEAINALPNQIVYNAADKKLIEDARTAFNNLRNNESDFVDEQRLLNAESAYIAAGKVYVEELISAIGEVNENSLVLIQTARSAFDQAIPEIRQVVSNYNILLDAETAFESYHVASVVSLIDNLIDTENIPITDRQLIMESQTEYLFALNVYNQLSDTLKQQVTNVLKLLDGLTVIEDILKPFEIADFIDAFIIENLTVSNAQQLVSYYELFTALDSTQLSILTQNQIEKLNAAWQQYQTLLEQTTIEFYHFNGTNPYFVVTKGTGAASGVNVNGSYGDLQITRGLKMESATKVEITTRVDNAKLYILLNSTTKSDNLKIDGQIYTAVDNVIEVTLSVAKSYLIERGSGEGHIIYMTVTEGGN